MLYKNVCIEAYGYELPGEVVTSDEIENRLTPVYERLKLPYGRLELISGIKERRFWKDGTRPSQVGILSAQKAIENSGISKKDIGCLVHSSVCRDFLEPATATVVHSALDLPHESMVFDVSNACLGFINSMVLLANMIELGQVKAGIVVAGESGKRLLDATVNEILNNTDITRNKLKYYFASLTIGSGAVAIVMAHSSISKTGHRIIGGQFMANTAHNELCVGGVGAEVAYDGDVSMWTDSNAVLSHGLELARDSWSVFKTELDLDDESFDRFFCHQVGSMHRKRLYEILELDMEKDFSTLEYLGNVGSVSLPITMAIGIEKGILKRGDRAAMLGIGSGLNCLMLGIEW